MSEDRQPGSTERSPQAEPEAMSRRTALGYSTALVAGIGATSLVPGAAVAAEAGGESVPMRSVSLEQANRLLAAAVRYVRNHPAIPPMYVLVVDACGEEKASRRMDGNSPAAVVLVPPKARTARAFRTPTIDLGANVTDPGRIASFTSAGFSLLGGGRPIVEGDHVLGAIGVGGGSPDQDDEVARAALAAL